MGNTQPKSKSSKESGKNGKASSVQGWSEFGSEKLDLLLNDDEKRTRLKNLAKQNQEANDSIKTLLKCLEFWEICSKRKSIFLSGQQCGDTEEAGKEKLYNNGNAIVDKYIK